MASAVVIGGGIVGSSIAHYLAQKGLEGVVLLEKYTIAGGATGKSGALVRMHYSNPWDATLALKSLEVFANWDDLIGGDPGFHKTGFIQLVGQHDREKLLENVEMLKGIGVNTWTISLEDLRILQPYCNVEGIGAAAYEPDSGYGDGYSAATGMARRARELGVQVRQGVEVLRIIRQGDRIFGVDTSEGELETPVVVLAAGAWSASLARTVNVELPVAGRPLAAGVLERPTELRGPHMTVIDQDRGIYFRPDVGNLTLVGIRSSHPGEVVEVDADSYDGNIEMEFKANTALQLAHRLPAMANALWRRDWTGVDGYTPDGHMVLGPAEGIEGLYVAAGMSGTGFKTGPAVGMAVADLVLDGQTTTVDVRPFRMSRFREGQPFPTDHDYVVPPYPDTAQ